MEPFYFNLQSSQTKPATTTKDPREAVSLRLAPEAALPSSPSERSNACTCGTSLSHVGHTVTD